VTRRAVKTSLLTPLLPQCKDYQVVAVDEGQFYPDIVEFCETLASQDKIVLVSALDGTFERKPFGRILELVPLAEKVIKLRAICVNCGDDAPFTKRICESKEVELLGGA
jgi:thymidine kinase